jgi:hypothetical protein
MRIGSYQNSPTDYHKNRMSVKPARPMTPPMLSARLKGSKELESMAFIMCDDHNLSVEADGVDPAAAKQLMLNDAKQNPSATEREVIEFGKVHRECNIRILAD